ncbi:unnamed protein product [Paramecium pentaurelia]|uniref:Nuclear migration protein nudC n=1 Tax=Paramecium pentaurelia TaxID=43138 RepID=A0A8S1RV47_9CILI|nr:unnamed protein product [Paramecium pentaurelia]
MTEDNKYDGLFMTIMQQTKDINVFFDAAFGFLRRHTDFFLDQKQAEKVITESCAKNFLIFQSEKVDKDKKEEQRRQREEQRKREKEAAEKAKKEAERLQQQQLLQQQQEKLEQQKQQQQQQQQQQLQQQEPLDPSVPVYQPVLKVPEQLPKEPEKKEGEGEGEAKDGEKKDDNEKPPIGNGGRTERYIWTQTLEEVQVYIPIPSTVTSKQLTVKIESSSLLVGLKGQPPIVNGQLFEKIQSDESTWLLTDGEIQDYKGKYIHISITKYSGQMNWWACVIKGDLQINTQKISPEPSQLSDLDGDTRGTVEKMMFDMRQKQMGLPSSDELQKKNKLAEFMKAHPEMDFSKCKFN